MSLYVGKSELILQLVRQKYVNFIKCNNNNSQPMQQQTFKAFKVM